MNKYNIVLDSKTQYLANITIKSDLTIEELNNMICKSTEKFIMLDNCIINIDQILFINKYEDEESDNMKATCRDKLYNKLWDNLNNCNW